jgi:hypothetical protein
MILFARYGVLLRPENINGDSLEVDVFSSPQGDTDVRVVDPGDVVLEVVSSDQGSSYGSLWVVRAGLRWQLAANQPVPGDLVVTTCPASDLLYQSGGIVVFASDGSFVPAGFGVMLALTGNS